MPVTVLITSCSFSMKCHFTPFMWHLACTSIKLITIKIHTDAHCLFPVLSLTISALFLAVVNPSTALAD